MQGMPEQVNIIKLTPELREVWRYPAVVLRRTEDSVLIQAHFTREDMPFHEIVLKKGDRFIEIYFSDRWYNIMEIHDRDDDHLKGWYCNVTMPTEISPQEVRYVDLALDLLVYPDGRQLVLDEDEFLEITISDEMQRQARAALNDLQALFTRQEVNTLLG